MRKGCLSKFKDKSWPTDHAMKGRSKDVINHTLQWTALNQYHLGNLSHILEAWIRYKSVQKQPTQYCKKTKLHKTFHLRVRWSCVCTRIQLMLIEKSEDETPAGGYCWTASYTAGCLHRCSSCEYFMYMQVKSELFFFFVCSHPLVVLGHMFRYAAKLIVLQ